MRSGWVSRALCVAGMTVAASGPGAAQVAISANDGKAILVDGVNTVPRLPVPDTATILDLGVSPPRIVGEVQVPTAVIGPPQSVAITRDESLALITSAIRIDPTDASRTTSNDIVSVVDLRASPPAVVATLHAGQGASGVSINRQGTLALVANRIDGTISVFRIAGRMVTPAGTVSLGAPNSGPSHVVFTPDGTRALVTRYNDHIISMLAIAGTTVTDTKQEITAGLRPYSIDITPTGDRAVVGHTGAGATGGVDVIAVVDLRAVPMRTVNQVAVGDTVEGVALSPDGRYVAATVVNGTNRPSASPLHQPLCRVRVFELRGDSLTPVAELSTGVWCQGVAWSRDGRRLAVQSMAERELQILAFDGRTLTRGPSLPLSAGPAGLRTAMP